MVLDFFSGILLGVIVIVTGGCVVLINVIYLMPQRICVGEKFVISLMYVIKK